MRIEHSILIKKETKILYKFIYSLFTKELRVLREYIKNNLEKE